MTDRVTPGEGDAGESKDHYLKDTRETVLGVTEHRCGCGELFRSLSPFSARSQVDAHLSLFGSSVEDR